MTANAIKAILATAKRLEKKLARVEVRSISDLKNYIKSIKRNLKKFEARLRKIKNQVTVSLAGVTVREQEALQCLLDLPIDRWDKDSMVSLFYSNIKIPLLL